MIPALEITNLSKRYHLQKQAGRTGEPAFKEALRGVSFKVEQGEVVGVIGMNGAGKSTLLKLISRITAASIGSIRIKGSVRSILEVGIGFIPELSGRENVKLYADLHGVSRKTILDRLPEILSFSEIGNYIDQPVKFYSTGMYLRLAFSTIIAFDADIYLFDEILTGGDIRFRSKVLGYIRALKKSGKTILIVTHSPSELTGICDRMILLHQGVLIKDAPPMEVIQTLGRLSNLLNEQAGSSNKEVFQMEGPQNATITVNSMNFFGPGQSPGPLRRENEITIGLNFNKSDDVKSDVILNINTQTGQTVMSTSTFFDEATLPTMRGSYFLRFVIPARVLIPGSYTIKVYFVTRDGHRLCGSHNPEPIVIIGGEMQDKYDFMPAAIYMNTFKDVVKID